jgi:hypothetical protein
VTSRRAGNRNGASNERGKRTLSVQDLRRAPLPLPWPCRLRPRRNRTRSVARPPAIGSAPEQCRLQPQIAPGHSDDIALRPLVTPRPGRPVPAPSPLETTTRPSSRMDPRRRPLVSVRGRSWCRRSWRGPNIQFAEGWRCDREIRRWHVRAGWGQSSSLFASGMPPTASLGRRLLARQRCERARETRAPETGFPARRTSTSTSLQNGPPAEIPM